MRGLKRHFWGTIFALLLAASAHAANWSAPATDLAKSIATVTGSGPVTLTIVNSSALADSDVSDIRLALEARLYAAGVRVASSAATDVRVTLSENLRGYLWVAEIKTGNGTQVEMVSVPRAEPIVVTHGGPSVTIHKTLLWSQPKQILDAYVESNRLVLLDSDTVSTFTMNSGIWRRDQTLNLIHGHAFPRDLRGLLVPAKDHLADVYLPGTVCSVTVRSGEAIACHDGDDPWPLGDKTALFNSSRNYFTEVLSISNSPGPFYSLAAVPRGNENLLVTTGVDWRVQITSGSSNRTLPPSVTSDWGSDIAALRSSCGTGTQLLVTSAVDDAMTDSLRAFEIPDRAPMQVSAAADFPGPITALWTHGNTATAVARNLQTGNYEAYSVSITCNQ